jgi:hypothetical protein
MPTRGLSLVDPDPAALVAEWQAAKNSLGPPFANAGHPDIQPLPASQRAHVQQILAHPVFAGGWHGATIELVEIDPVLAYQMTIDVERSDHHGRTLSTPPSIDQLMATCLPINPPLEDIKVAATPTSFALTSKSLNVRQFDAVVDQTTNFMGIRFGISLPWVHVVRYGGRCHLYNGYHRSLCARRAGATHIPCIVRDVADHSQVLGFDPPGFFPAALLASGDAPTLGHFTQGRAKDVALRAHHRLLVISWAEHAIQDE